MKITALIENVLNPILQDNHGVASLKKVLREIQKEDKYMSKEFLSSVIRSMGYFIINGTIVSTN